MRTLLSTLRRGLRRPASVWAAPALLFSLLALAPTGARAATYNVNSVAGLEAALSRGTGSDTINLAPGTYVLDQTLYLNNSDTINGAGQGVTVLSGGGLRELFFINGGSPTLSNLTLTGGNNANMLGTGAGGAILDRSALTVTLDHVTLIGNVSNTGGAIYVGYTNEVYVDGQYQYVQQLILNGCTLTGNRAVSITENIGGTNYVEAGDGGALANGSSGGGSGGEAALINCVLVGNTATDGGAIYNVFDDQGGAYEGVYVGGTGLTDCTLTQNSAYDGGAIYTYDGSVGLVDDILYNDAATQNNEINPDPNDPYGGETILVSDIGQNLSLGATDLDADPLFVNAPYDLHVRPTSPCIGVGTANPNGLGPTTDITGAPRHYPPTIGAYEVPTSTTLAAVNQTGTTGIGVPLNLLLTSTGTTTGTTTGTSSALTYGINSDPSNGSLTGFDPATGAVTYTPSAGFSGTDTFTFSVRQGSQFSAPATVTIDVAAQFNHYVITAPPTAVAGVPVTVTITGGPGSMESSGVQPGGSSHSVGGGGGPIITTVNLTSTDARAALPASVTLSNGAGTASVTFNTVGTQTVSVLSGTTLVATSNFVTVAASLAGPPKITVSGVSVTSSGNGGVTAYVTLTNVGAGDATDVHLTLARLGGKGATSLGSAFSISGGNGTATVAVPFPAITPTGAQTLLLGAAYTSPTGTTSALSASDRVTVP